jgi:hypothetical protein
MNNNKRRNSYWYSKEFEIEWDKYELEELGRDLERCKDRIVDDADSAGIEENVEKFGFEVVEP